MADQIEDFGTFTKGGQTKHAQSLEHAVKYAFEGWNEVDGTATAAAEKYAAQVRDEAAAKAERSAASKPAKATTPRASKTDTTS